MPTTLSTNTTISGIIRNDTFSLNSVPKIEINIDIGTSKNKFDYGEFEFVGQDNTTNSIPPISSSTTYNSVGIKENISTVNFYGSFSRPETVVINQQLDLNVTDSQDYVTVIETIEVEGPYWS